MGEVNPADDPRLHRKGVNITLRIASQSFEDMPLMRSFADRVNSKVCTGPNRRAI